MIFESSGVNTKERHFLFIFIVPINSFDLLHSKYMSPNLPHAAMILPSEDTSKFWKYKTFDKSSFETKYFF